MNKFLLTLLLSNFIKNDEEIGIHTSLECSELKTQINQEESI